MKTKYLIPFLLLFFTGALCQQRTVKSAFAGKRSDAAYDCNSWLQLRSEPSYVNIGKLDIPGTQLTVEAIINRTSLFSGGIPADGDVVSKHASPADVNYLLRPTGGLITTSDGFFATPPICDIQLNKTYHIAMVYDGQTLKFYRNGFLMSAVPATGNLWQNAWDTHIGLLSPANLHGNYVGYINEVRIWNVVRTQAEIRANIGSTLSAPATQTGLLAYYVFNDLTNKQGNPAWNGTLVGSAAIAQSLGANCTLLADSCERVINTTLLPSFTIPDTVCVNMPVTIANTTVGATTHYWNFCVADIDKAPLATNLGNPGGFLASPTFMDYAQYNGNWYGIATNYQDGKLTRLDFGNSLLNTPTAVSLGNFPGSLIPTNII
ncbi:MAG: LamG domain-containing protein, partial [Bacteroidota bacterium]|nr:LamG domain-containing protein [Bacteroidota bacterium]